MVGARGAWDLQIISDYVAQIQENVTEHLHIILFLI